MAWPLEVPLAGLHPLERVGGWLGGWLGGMCCQAEGCTVGGGGCCHGVPHSAPVPRAAVVLVLLLDAVPMLSAAWRSRVQLLGPWEQGGRPPLQSAGWLLNPSRSQPPPSPVQVIPYLQFLAGAASRLQQAAIPNTFFLQAGGGWRGRCAAQAARECLPPAAGAPACTWGSCCRRAGAPPPPLRAPCARASN